MHRDNPCVTKQGIFFMKKVLNPKLKVDESAKNDPNKNMNTWQHINNIPCILIPSSENG
jgi:hypothetical protein